MPGDVKAPTGVPVQSRLPGATVQTTGKDGSSHATAHTTAASSAISLTDTAAKLRRLEAALADIPVVNVEQVKAVKRAIAEGNYQIDPGRIAEKLLEFERMLHTDHEYES